MLHLQAARAVCCGPGSSSSSSSQPQVLLPPKQSLQISHRPCRRQHVRHPGKAGQQSQPLQAPLLHWTPLLDWTQEVVTMIRLLCLLLQLLTRLRIGLYTAQGRL